MDTPSKQPHHEAVHEERRKLKWFLGFVLVILLITAGTDLIFSFYGSPNIPKERNPFVTVESTPTPTPSLSPSIQPVVTTPPQQATPSGAKPPKGDIMCTMDAKMCPDGKTFVGRSGPNCEFMACPK